VFYDQTTGRPRTVAEIYRALGGRIEQEAQSLGGFSGAEDAASDAPPYLATASARRIDLAGLRLSGPTVAMLDAMTLTALKLLGDSTPRRQPESRATQV